MTARRVTIAGLLALCEAAVLLPFVWLLVPPPAGLTLVPQLALVWGILFGLAVQWQFLGHRGVSLRAQRLLMGFWLAVLIVLAEVETFSMLAGMQPDVLTMAPAFIAAVGLWWRGMVIGTDDLHPRTAELHLQAGLLLLILSSFATLFIQNQDVFIQIIAFFAGALGAIPLCNLEMTASSSIGRPVPMTRGWWGWVVLPVLGLLTTGLGLAALFTGRSAAEVLALLLGIILLPLIFILSFLPVALLDSLFDLLRRLTAGFGQLGSFGQNMPDLPQSEAGPPPIVLPPQFNFGLALLVLAGVAVLVIWLMRRADKPLFAPQATSGDLEGGLPEKPVDAAGAMSNALGLSALRRWLSQMTVRRLYVRAVSEAGKRGFKRQPTQTPYDFLPDMQRAFPEHVSEARDVTEAYIASHYGQVPDSDEALNALKQSWERMRHSSRG
jgi:hypothetical protein